jgi:polyhydroxyalkanoate synthase subunit PhaC
MASTSRNGELPEDVVDSVAPDAPFVGLLDPVGFRQVLVEVAGRAACRPADPALVAGRFFTGLAAAVAACAARALGAETRGPIEPQPGDRRFADPAWSDNPGYFGLMQAYLLNARMLHELVDAAQLEKREEQKAHFATDLVVRALAPTNLLLGNPTALKHAFETGGISLARGTRNFLEDVGSNGGFPRQVDRSAFTVGENLAATPGAVVFRNELIELIQYAPQTETTYEIPLLFSPPWINKYYVMDLAPGKSFAEWAITHGHTVFTISYRNPDESLAETSFEDYLRLGPLTALDVIREVTGVDQVNIVGLCLGGTLTGILLAHLASLGEDRVRSATLLNSLLDFSEPGALGCFTDPASVARLERQMADRGYLEKTSMARVFDLLRADDLIWNYVGNNWLMGKDPPAFDLLAWNADGTNMPARMQSEYIKACYLDNALARGELELLGTRIDLGAVPNDLYMVGAEEDHIVPWRSNHAGTQLLGGPVRFVLSSSGHIAGIVNPAGPSKRCYWVTDDATGPTTPAAWRRRAKRHAGSWWEDWSGWIGGRAGARREPPPLGSSAYPALEPAPGTYVFGA